MPDLLTSRFKQELEKKGIVATDTEVSQFLTKYKEKVSIPSKQESLWESIQAGDAPDWYAEAIPEEPEGGMLRALGVAAWSGLDIATLGVAGVAAPGITKWAMPETFGERAASAIGGLAGFLVPFAAARAVATKAVSTMAKQGVSKVAKTMVDDTSKILKQDKGFMTWWGGYARKNKLGPKDLDEFIKGVTEYPVAKITVLGSKIGKSSVNTTKGRATYVKEFRENVPKIVNEYLGGFKVRKTLTEIKGMGQLEKKITDSILSHVGQVTSGGSKVYKFPMTSLHELFAAKMGNGKIANLAASAMEESALFTAVEMPMHVIQSMFNDEIEWNPMGTLGHAAMLGSALGLFRFIPGGKGLPIAGSMIRRATKGMSKKKRYARYDTAESADRLALATHLKAIVSQRPDLLKAFRQKVVEPGAGGRSIEKLFSTGKKEVGAEIDAMASTKKGAQELKDMLVTIEETFLKDWWPGFIKEAPGDIWGSIPRMFAISMAFNFPLYLDWMKGAEIPAEDMIFHTALGAVLGKKGRQLSYLKDGELVVSGKDRPYMYNDDFKKVDEYLNIVQSNPDSSLYRMWMNDYEAIRNGWGGLRKDSKDMQKLLQIAQDNGLIVEDAGKYKRKPAKGKTADNVDELYDNFAALVSLNFLDPTKNQLVKASSELSNKQVAKVLRNLRDVDGGFEALQQFRSKQSQYDGITSTADLFNVVLGSSEKEAANVISLTKRAVIEAYNKIHEIENPKDPFLLSDIDGEVMDIRRIEVPAHLKTNVDYTRMSEFLNNAMSLMVGTGKFRYIKGKDTITLNAEMADSLFGKRFYDSDGLVSVDKVGLLDKYDDRLTELILGEQVSDPSRKITLGHNMINDWVTNVSFRQNIRDTWETLDYLFKGPYKEGRPFGAAEGEVEYARMQSDMRSIFERGGALVTDVTFVKYDAATGKSVPLSAEEISGSTRNKQALSFAKGILQVLRNDIAGARISGGFGERNVAEVTPQSVIKVMNSFRDYNVQGFSLRGEVRDNFISQLSEYALDKSVGGMVKSDGSPITASDRTMVSLLLQSRVLSGNLTVPDIGGIIGDTFTRLAEFEKAHVETTNLKAIVELMESKGYDDIPETTRTFMEVLKSRIDDSKADSDTYLTDLLNRWNETIGQFVRTREGGFIDVDGKAVVEAGHLVEVIELIDALNTAKYATSHVELMDAIRKSNHQLGDDMSGAPSEFRRFLTGVHNILHDRPGNSHRAIQLLINNGIYDRRGFFAFDDLLSKEGPKAYEILKRIEQQLYFNFSALESKTGYERLLELDVAELGEITRSSMGLSSSFDNFVKVNGVSIDAQPGKSLSEVVREMDLDATSFFEYMRDKSNIKFKGKIFSGSKGFARLSTIEGGRKEQERFLNEALNVFSTMFHSRQVVRLHALGDGIPQRTIDTIKKNNLWNVMKNIGIELMFVDPNFKLSARSSVNIMQTNDQKAIENFYRRMAQAQAVGKKGLGDETQVVEDVVAGIENLDFGDIGATGNYVAWLGSFSNGIAIPIKMSGVLATKFVKTYEAKKAEWKKQGLHKTSPYKRVIKGFDKFISDNMDKVEKEKDVVEYTYKDLRDVGPRISSQHMSTMLSTVFGNQVMGKSFWDSVVNDWDSPVDFAQNVMRRIKLATNRQHIPLTKDYVNQVINLIGKSRANFLKDVQKNVLPLMKQLNNKGMKFHVVRDEKVEGEDVHPAVTSVLRQYNLQLKEEMGAANLKEGQGFKDVKEENGALKFGVEGMEDASVVNSVNIIGRAEMEAIKMFLGFYQHDGVMHSKPIGMKSSDGDMVMIDKTAFIVDKNWEPYLAKNKISGIMFTSSTKMLGDAYRDRVINLRESASLEDFITSRNDGKDIKFDLEDFAFGQFVNDKHDATIALQVGSDLIGESLNNKFYNWLMGGKVKDYIDKTSVFGTGNNYGIDALINAGNSHLIDTVEGNPQLSTMDIWTQGGGPSHFFPFKRTVNNSIKKALIDRAGIFSPRNKYGSQSILVPSYLSHGTDGHLRNTTFVTEADGSRSLWTYGQIEMDKNNRYKPVDLDNLRVIRHRSDGKDELIRWDQIKGLDKYEKAFQLKGDKQARTLGEVFDFLKEVNRGEEKYNLVEKKRVKGYAADLSGVRSVGNLRSISDAIIVSNKKDHKYIIIRDNINVGDLIERGIIEPDTKGGERARGQVYKNIKIVGDYYRLTRPGVKGKDLIVVDNINQAKRQFLNYKEGGAKQFTGIEYGSEQLGKEASRQEVRDIYEIAATAQRMPSTRPSDKVIVGIKSLDLEGNAVRINSIDALTRLEADFDLDKLNYWWDTPPDILREWDKMSGMIDAVVPKRLTPSVKGLRILNGSALEKYAFDDQKTALYRGMYVKTRRLMQWLQHYDGSHADVKGMSFNSVLGEGITGTKLNPRIVLNDKASMNTIMRTVARDIQQIIDSQKGYDEQFYATDYFDKILFGVEGNPDYPGLFVRQATLFETVDGKQRMRYENEGSIEGVDRDVIKALVKPYGRLLSLASGIYETGVRENIDYQSMMTYARAYRWKMNNLGDYVMGSLMRTGKYSPKDIEKIRKLGYFGSSTVTETTMNPNVFNEGRNLLPFERALNFLTYEDHLALPPPERLPSDLVRRVDDWVSPLVQISRTDEQLQPRTSAAAKEIMMTIRKDIKNISVLNYINRRIREAKRGASRSREYNNTDAQQYFERERLRLTGVAEAISDRILSDKGVQRRIAGTIAKRMIQSLNYGNSVMIRDAKTDKVRFVNSMDGVSRADIFNSVWDKANNKLYGKVIGIPSDDYLQLQAWYEIMAKKVGLGLDPATFEPGIVNEWSVDVNDMRTFIREQWGDYWSNRSPSSTDGQYISNRIQNEMAEIYRKWEDRSEGLGQALIMSLTLPRLDLTKITYNSGNFGLAFKGEVAGEAKYISSALRFLATNEYAGIGGKEVVKELAKEFSTMYRTMRNGGIDNSFQDYVNTLSGRITEREIKNIFKGLDADNESPTDFVSYLDTILGGGNEGKPQSNKDVMDMINTNRDVMDALGLTGSVALDYISLKQPQIALGFVASLKNLISMDFIPSKALNNRGKIVGITGLNQFYRLKRRQARMFFADSGKNNMFTGERVPYMREIYGATSRPDIWNSRNELLDTADRHIEKDVAMSEGRVC